MRYAMILTSGKSPEMITKGIDTKWLYDCYGLAQHLLGTEYVEVVRPVGFMGKYAFFVNETGVNDNLPVNYYGSALYGTEEHHQIIAGDAVVVKQDRITGEIGWLTEKDLPEVKRLIVVSEMRFKEGMRELINKTNRGDK